MMEKEQRKQLVIQMLTAGIITFCLLWLLFYIKKYVPFGVHSLASKDADFQYLDFLAYLKDVFDGKNNIDYCFQQIYRRGLHRSIQLLSFQPVQFIAVVIRQIPACIVRTCDHNVKACLCGGDICILSQQEI